MVRIVNRKKPAVHYTVSCFKKSAGELFLKKSFESYEWAVFWAEKCLEKYPDDYVDICLDVEYKKDESFSAGVFSSDIDDIAYPMNNNPNYFYLARSCK